MFANFANPTSGATVTNDGFDAHVWFNPKRGDGTGTVLPSMLVEWVGTPDAAAVGTPQKKDMKNTAVFTPVITETTDNWRLSSTEMIHDDTNNQVAQSGTNLCAETWVYSNTAVACMKVTGTIDRNMKVSVASTTPANTIDDTDDFDFDFVDTQVSVMIGKVSEVLDTNNQFAAITVPFATFRESETASALNLGGAMFAAAMALFAAF